MLLTASDPDIATLVSRIQRAEIDLQPDFQRGEIWSDFKRKRLIDSILRNWHVPPVHLIVDADSGKESVLDGQQRLAAIRDFVDGKFAVDGNLEPKDSEIESLDGKFYRDLPEGVRRRFDRFTVRVLSITNYAAAEPSELFYRLNQPTSLTAAEQRNAFFGEARAQVKSLVADVARSGLGDAWGFSNARMSFDDVISRCLYILERGTLRERVSATHLADRFREGHRFGRSVVRRLQEAIELLGSATRQIPKPRYNKAAAQSMLIFACTLHRIIANVDSGRVAGFLSYFEVNRNAKDAMDERRKSDALLFSVFEDRSTSRVADAASVILRDLVLWIVYFRYVEITDSQLTFGMDSTHRRLAEAVFEGGLLESPDEYADRTQWGSVL